MRIQTRAWHAAMLFLIGALTLPLTAQDAGEKSSRKKDAQEEQKATQDEEQQDEEPVFESFKELQADYDKKYNAYRTAMMEASRERDREKLMESRKLLPKFSDYADPLMEFINEDPTSSNARKSMIWGISKAGTSKAGQTIQELLLEHHIESKQLETLLTSLARSRSPKKEPTLRRLMEKSPHEDIQAGALYYLIAHLESTKSKAEDEDEAQEEIDTLFKKLGDVYADIEDPRGVAYYARLEGQRFSAEHLQIGLPVPDIKGEDVDGVEFKLSDYKGKVVVIDFWGDW